MGARTTAREAALQMLYAVEAGEHGVERAISNYWRQTPGDAEGRPYADALVRGVIDQQTAIDERIRAASEHWRIERMARVDRNILRVGVFELTERPEVPRAVIIDEAVELAKRYGTEESGKFVNGVLDRIADDVGRRDDDRRAEGRGTEGRGTEGRGGPDSADSDTHDGGDLAGSEE